MADWMVGLWFSPVAQSRMLPRFGYIFICSCGLFYVGLIYSWGVIRAKLAAERLAPDSTSTDISVVSFVAIINSRLIRLLALEMLHYLHARY